MINTPENAVTLDDAELVRAVCNAYEVTPFMIGARYSITEFHMERRRGICCLIDFVACRKPRLVIDSLEAIP